MYAVVKTGGKQYRVAVGDKLKVESLKADIGETVTLDHVLMIADQDSVQVGTPTLDTYVQATVLANARGKKLRVVKFRRRQNSRTRNGHRQDYTELEITSIGGKAANKANDKTVSNADTQKADQTPESASAKDDLSRISGVGPVLVGKLEKLGITTFQQIADFTKEDIDRIDDELNFKGRIERDDWVKQANALLSDKDAH